jgi:catechol 2,3-dioxygenase-like lactoylglutathione lyase family enzyme
METNEIHRGRLLDHLHLVVADLARSQHFYSAILEVLEVPLGGEGPGFFWADELFVSTADSVAAQGKLTGRAHFAFQAKSKAAVDRFYKAGIAAGGTDNGPPGDRPYHPGYYAAFLLDPDGNNVEAVYHGPHTRSSETIKITF